jgi:hypothetical protein
MESRKPRSRRVPRASRREATRLAIEDLEGRTLLSTLTLMANGSLVYAQLTAAPNTLTVSDNPATHRYTFADAAENITLVGSFSNPSGNFTHAASFGDGNIHFITVNMTSPDFTVNIEQTLAIAPVTVNELAGGSIVNISPSARNLNNIQGPIYIYGGEQGFPAMNVYDNSNTAAQTFSLSANNNTGYVTRSGAATISYNNTYGALTINGGSGSNTYNVSGTACNTVTLNTGNGHDAVNVGGASSYMFVVNDGTGGVDVNVGGSSHNLNNVYGSIQVNGSVAGVDDVVVDDRANPSDRTFYIGGDHNGWSPLPGSDLTGYVGCNNLVSHLTVYGGFGAHTYDVSGTGVPTDIVADATATVTVGDDNHTVAEITHNLTITDPPAFVTLNVDDDYDVSARTATLQTVTIGGDSYGQITGLSTGAIAYRYVDTTSVNIYSDTSGAINVWATERPVNLGNYGATTVNVGNGGSVQAIDAPLTISDPEPGAVALNVDDSADGTFRTATLQTESTYQYSAVITGLSPAPIAFAYDSFSPAAVTVQTGTGGATVNALATGVPVNLIGHSAHTTVNVGNLGHVGGIQRPLTISNPPNFTTVNVNDSGDSFARAVTLDTVTSGGAAYGRITGLAPAAIEYKYGDTNPVTVQTGLGGATVHALATFTPVNLIGNSSAPIALVGSDADNTWSITGHDAGTLSSALLAGTVTFSGAANLTGGNGADTFVFADGAGVDGTIDGGVGTNTLDYSAYSSSVLVDLQTGAATGVGGGIANIQNVNGGTGGGAGVYNILVGNGGNVLTGGDGRRNLLIAGATASTLIGGNDDDILIGGTTAYDTEAGLVSLQAIMNYWSNTTDDYATRVANLLSGNGVPLLDATMVTNNGGGNTLTGNHGGGSEMNLFYGLDPTLETTDYNPAIGEQFINC